jgi:integrase
MAKPARFIPKKHPTRGWELNIPKAYSATGRRAKWYYPTQRQALNAAADLKAKVAEHGQGWKHASPLVISEAEHARETLAPWGIGIAAAASEYAAALAILKDSGLSILEAATQAAGQAKATAASKALSAAWESFLAAKAGKASRTLQGYKQLQKGMVEHFDPKRAIAEITGQELAAFINATSKGATSANLRRRYLRAWWNWCARLPRNWCDDKQAEALEMASTSASAISVLTPDETRALFTAAEAHHADMVPWLAVAIFAGCRQAELARMKAGDITPGGITVGVGNKTGRRHIALPAPLEAWLKAYPVPADKSAPLLPAGFAEKFDALRNLAGWRVKAKDCPKPKKGAKPWAQNILRHTSASLHVALGTPIERLSFEFGHSGGLQTLRKHYVGVLPKAEAVEIWTMGPDGSTLPLFAEVKPAKKRKGAA